MNTTLFLQLNWLHILVATFAYFGLGAVWYSLLFRGRWLAYQKITPDNAEAKKDAGAIMAFSFVLMYIAVVGLAILVSRLDLSLAISGVKLGLFTGICFSAMGISISYLYVKKPAGLHFIDGSYHIAGQVVAAVILCIWQ